MILTHFFKNIKKAFAGVGHLFPEFEFRPEPIAWDANGDVWKMLIVIYRDDEEVSSVTVSSGQNADDIEAHLEAECMSLLDGYEGEE